MEARLPCIFPLPSRESLQEGNCWYLRALTPTIIKKKNDAFLKILTNNTSCNLYSNGWLKCSSNFQHFQIIEQATGNRSTITDLTIMSAQINVLSITLHWILPQEVFFSRARWRQWGITVIYGTCDSIQLNCSKLILINWKTVLVWETWLYLWGWNPDWMEYSPSIKAQNKTIKELFFFNVGVLFPCYSRK